PSQGGGRHRLRLPAAARARAARRACKRGGRGPLARGRDPHGTRRPRQDVGPGGRDVLRREPADGAADEREGGRVLLSVRDRSRRHAAHRGARASPVRARRVLDRVPRPLLERGRPTLQPGRRVEGEASQLPLERARVADDQLSRHRCAGARRATPPGRMGGAAGAADPAVRPDDDLRRRSRPAELLRALSPPHRPAECLPGHRRLPALLGERSDRVPRDGRAAGRPAGPHRLAAPPRHHARRARGRAGGGARRGGGGGRRPVPRAHRRGGSPRRLHASDAEGALSRMASLTLRRLTKTFDARTKPALQELSLEVRDGEFLVLLGPSGCGKTTALRCIAGLEEPTTGEILIGERDVTHLPPGDRDVAMVFQNYALYPHLTARANLAFGLEVRGVARPEIARRVQETAQRLGLTELLDRLPASSSGGQRQRVALGRAIVRAPRAFLFDEPLSNLDAQLRSELRRELLGLHRALGATMVYVTHDQVEAMTMGQRIAVLYEGRLRQLGTPVDV